MVSWPTNACIAIAVLRFEILCGSAQFSASSVLSLSFLIFCDSFLPALLLRMQDKLLHPPVQQFGYVDLVF